jgi:hypothetical protein
LNLIPSFLLPLSRLWWWVKSRDSLLHSFIPSESFCRASPKFRWFSRSCRNSASSSFRTLSWWVCERAWLAQGHSGNQWNREEERKRERERERMDAEAICVGPETWTAAEQWWSVAYGVRWHRWSGVAAFACFPYNSYHHMWSVLGRSWRMRVLAGNHHK